MEYECCFDPPKFGKPYDDEFNLAKPKVHMYEQNGNQGSEWIMEAEFTSEKFAGLMVTQIVSLSAVGLIYRKHRIHNKAQTDKHAMIGDGYWLQLYHNSVIPYNGGVTKNSNSPQADSTLWGHSELDAEKIDENWIFEDIPRNPRGFCWSSAYKPHTKWGRELFFEIDAGILAPGQSFETEPMYYVCGLFGNYNDFRNFAMKQYRHIPEIAVPSVDLRLNNYNPFISNKSCKLEVINNRSMAMEGQVSVSSPDNLFAPQSQTNPAEEIVAGNTFDIDISPSSPVGLLNLRLHLALYDKSYTRAMFFPRGEIVSAKEGDVYTISNGCITFSASPSYSAAVYSLATLGANGEKREWLDSRYPNHEAFSWFNPFIGGIQTFPEGMNWATQLKEHIKADFVKMPDSFGNEWFGIRTTLEIKNFDELKGAIYESYYVSLPGLPVLCNFFRINNGTGIFKKSNARTETFLKVSEDIKNTYGESLSKDHIRYRMRAGASGQDATFDNMVKFTGDDGQKEKLYVYHKAQGDQSYFAADNNVVSTVIETNFSVAPSSCFTSRPTFYLITERDLLEESLVDLERISFIYNFCS